MNKPTEQEEIPSLSLILKCTACDHMDICAPFRGISQMLEAYRIKEEKLEKAPPFEAEDLAQICTKFFPMALADQLRTQSEDKSYL